MDNRQRSPSYPSTPLSEAIDLVKKIHSQERTNPIDREVAVRAMGYSGISGRSATVLSNLIQFGLVEKTGKNEVRVTRRAIDIIYPDNDASKADALFAAAQEPELFRAVAERFTDGLPSEPALQSYLIRQGFTHAAVPAATRAYLETFLFLENAIGRRGNLIELGSGAEIHVNQTLTSDRQAIPVVQPSARADSPSAHMGNLHQVTEGYDVRIWRKTLYLGGTVRTRNEADELIETINALKMMLPAAIPSALFPPADEEPMS